jgi:uncharacterized membrane protein YbaN (DUF454 family)
MVTDDVMDRETPEPAVGLHRAFLLLLGAAATLLGAIGLVFPIIPGIPLLGAAATCFARSSPGLHRWLINLPAVGPLLHRMNDAPQLAWHWRLLLALAIWAAAIYALAIGTKVFWLRVAVLVTALVLTLSLLVLPAIEAPRRIRRKLLLASA